MPTPQFGSQVGSIVAGGSAQGPFAPPSLDWPVVAVERVGEDEITPGWLGHKCSVNWPVNKPATAEVEVRTGKGFLVNIGTNLNAVYEPIEKLLPDDALITIRTDRQHPASNQILFVGYASQYRRSGGRAMRVSVQLTHRIVELNEDSERAVYGQLRLSRPMVMALSSASAPPQLEQAPRWYLGLPCVLNPDGVKNCRPRILKLIEGEGEEASEWILSVFTDGLDPKSQSWSWARVLVYLLYWARRNLEDGQVGDWNGKRYRDLNLMAKIRALGADTIDPDTIEELPDDPWLRALTGKPGSLSLDGMGWLDALTFCCAKAGIGWHTEDEYDDELKGVVTGIRFFVPGGDAARFQQCRLASPDYETADLSWGQVLAKNDVASVELSSDYSQVINSVTAVGGVNQYEITTQLVPLWKPNSDWDVNQNSASEVNQKAAAAADDSFWDKYGTSGAQFKSNQEFGRVWGLPDISDLAEYKRQTGPFAEAIDYEPLELALLGIGELRGGQDPLANLCAVRARKLRELFTARGVKSRMAPIVEVSFDSGGSWLWLNGSVEVAQRTARIYLTGDLRSIVGGNPAENFAQVYIRGKLRIRITCSIEGDQAYTFGASSLKSLSRRLRGAIALRRTETRSELRDDDGTFSGGNSQFKDSTQYPAIEEKPKGEAAFSERYLQRQDRVIHRGTIELPFLVLPKKIGEPGIFDGYRPGDEIIDIKAQDGASDHTIPLRARKNEDDFAVVAAVTHEFALGDGQSQPSAYSTTLRIEDSRAILQSGRA